MGHANAQFFVPAPLGPWEGPKGEISINFIYKVNFKGSIDQTLCVSSLIKDIKHIRPDSHLVSWVMPQGWYLAVQKNNFTKSSQIWLCKINEWGMQRHKFFLPRPH